MKRATKTTGIILAVLIICAAAVFVIAPDKRKLDDDARAGSDYDFADLSEGLTEYEIAGPAAGPRVVLVHGLSVPMYDWDRQFRDLAMQGFRVLRYNQFGRGLSDRPRGAYDSSRYVRQLRELIAEQGWHTAHLVGHSMGCAIIARFAVEHPAAVDRMVLVSPTLHIAQDNAGVSLARVPVVGDIAGKAVIASVLASRADGLLDAAGVAQAEEYSEAFREQMRYRGFTRSVKSLFRGDMVDDLSDTYRQLDGSRVRMIWGTRDESVPGEHFDTLIDLLPGTEPVLLEGVGHAPNMERPDEVTDLIVRFLESD